MPDITFKGALEKLSSNDPKYIELDFRHITITPFCNEGTIFYQYDDTALFKIAEALKNNHTIKIFYLNSYISSDSRQKFTVAGIQALINALKNHPNLQTVHLTLGNTINDDEALSFLEILTGTANIQNLNLDIFLNDKLVAGLGEALQKNKTLSHININNFNFERREYNTEAIGRFALGLSNKKLTSLALKYIALQDFGIQIIVEALKQNNSLIELSIELYNLTTVGLTSIRELLASNNQLYSLNLSKNRLNEIEIKSLIDTFSLLPQLTHLSLHKLGLNCAALSYLIAIWQQHNLKIKTFSFDVIGTDWAWAIGQLIDGNNRLKGINIQSQEISENHIKSLEPILSNPHRCKLKEFTFGMDKKWPLGFEELLIDIMSNNPNLKKLSPATHSYKLWKAWDKNCEGYRNSQRNFINNAIKLGNIYTAPKADNAKPHISLFPYEIILMIITYLGQNTLGMEEINLRECAELIIHNFEQRRFLINKKLYSPTSFNKSELPNIKQWWSMWTKTKEHNKQIFRTETELTKHANATIQDCNIM